ncbi:MAG: ATP-binding protein, partial [Phycisphaerae bacterium]|nr:ATP-binding protein [Phycisphaerae bacterium]NIX27010.1 AAA family ATPase [Phycisphaerae bacterium]
VIWGEPGAGKSHLAHEFLTHHLNPDSQTQVFLAQSDEILRQSLNPFRYWLKQYFGISDGLAESRNKRSFNRKLDALIGETNDKTIADELDRIRSFLGALVGLHWSDSLYEQVEAKARQENTFLGLTILLQAESQRHPVILLLEDAHWMDKDSAAFLSNLLPELDHTNKNHYPLAILATARYEGHGLPLEGFTFQEINLSEMNRTNLAALAQNYLDAPPSENLLNLLVER